MKTTFKFIVALAITAFTFGACKNKTTVQTEVKNNATAGTWKITKYVDSGKDETADFTRYTFTFANDGTVTASDTKGFVVNGSWSITDNNSKDDTKDDLHFVISFPTTNNFDKLNDDWSFISQSSTKIELTDVSGGNGGTDYLTFEKN